MDGNSSWHLLSCKIRIKKVFCPFVLWETTFDVCDMKRLISLPLQGSLLWGVRNPFHYATLPASGMEQSELLYKSWLKEYTRNIWQLLAAFRVLRKVCCHRPWGAEEEGSRNQPSVKLTAGIWKYHAEVIRHLPFFLPFFALFEIVNYIIPKKKKSFITLMSFFNSSENMLQGSETLRQIRIYP